MSAKKFNYGGQAVIEGVMMRGRKAMVTAVRRPSGDININAETLSSIYTGRLRKVPLVRGIIVLIETLALGIKTLLYSANIALEEEEEKISGRSLWGLVAVTMVLAIGIFFVVPLFITRAFNSYLPSSIAFNLVDGVIRLAFFLAYLKIITFVPDIKRVFAYHGAEHMTVNAYENGMPLEVEAIKKYGTAHVRCGTSFLFVVMIIAIVVFALIGKPSLPVMITSRVILIPVIAAIGYEVTQFSSRHTGNSIVRAFMAPGMWLQSMTTRQPDDSQLEVAIEALKGAVEADRLEETDPVPA